MVSSAWVAFFDLLFFLIGREELSTKVHDQRLPERVGWL